MELMADLEPEEARAIVDPALEVMMDAVPSLWRLHRNPTATGSSHCSAHRSDAVAW